MANRAVIRSVPGKKRVGVDIETISVKDSGECGVGEDEGVVGSLAPIGLLLHRNRHGELSTE